MTGTSDSEAPCTVRSTIPLKFKANIYQQPICRSVNPFPYSIYFLKAPKNGGRCSSPATPQLQQNRRRAWENSRCEPDRTRAPSHRTSRFQSSRPLGTGLLSHWPQPLCSSVQLHFVPCEASQQERCRLYFWNASIPTPGPPENRAAVSLILLPTPEICQTAEHGRLATEAAMEGSKPRGSLGKRHKGSFELKVCDRNPEH